MITGTRVREGCDLGYWLKRWLTTTNHKDIGIMYLVTSLYFLFLGGALGELIRIQLAVPDNNFLQPLQFNEAVTMHGLINVLWFLSPLGFAFANYFVPLQIGAKDLAFPRLNALSYWLYLFGGLVAALGFFFPGGAAAVGWTAYAPLTSLQYSPGFGLTLGAAGLLMLVASVTVSTINFIVTIIYMRSPEVTFSKIPLFTWFIFFTVIMMLLAFPALLAALVMLAADRILGTLFFASPAGGALMWDHLFWFFGHPEVYIVLLPAFGAVSEIIQTFSSRPIYAKKAILLSLVAATILSVIVWAHHMYITGINLEEREFFTITTESISIPFGVIIISFIWTLRTGVVRLTTPMLFAIGSIVVFIIGGITGVFNSSVALDIGLRGTYWVVAHFHYTLVGAALFGLWGAIYYWYPKISGKMYSERIGKTHFILSFVGFNVLYFPMFWLVDMPRRIFTYLPGSGWGLPNMIATIGAIIFGASQILLILNTISPLISNVPIIDQNPWSSDSPEWGLAPMRPNGGISLTKHGQDNTETLHSSSRPLTLSLGLAMSFVGLGGISMPFLLPILAVGLVIFILGLYGWLRDDFYELFDIADETHDIWPIGKVSKVSLGILIFLASEVLLFGSIIASYIFIRENIPTWPAIGSIHSIPVATVMTILLLTSGLTMFLAVESGRSNDLRNQLIWLSFTFILGSSFLSMKVSEWIDLFSKGFTFSSGLPGSTFYVMTGIHGAHVLAGLIVLAYLITKTFKGGFTNTRGKTVQYFGMYWGLVDIVWLFLFPLLYLM